MEGGVAFGKASFKESNQFVRSQRNFRSASAMGRSLMLAKRRCMFMGCEVSIAFTFQLKGISKGQLRLAVLVEKPRDTRS